MVIRGGHPCDSEREVLLGLESDADMDAAAYAFQEAERRGVRLRVLHSWAHRRLTPEVPSPLPRGRDRLVGRRWPQVPLWRP